MNEQATTEITYSFVCPVFNEEPGLEHFYERLKEVAESLGEPYEIVFVNDGSTDDSLAILRKLADQDGSVRYVDFSRNFGHQIAVTAGYDYACGKAVITLDSDCQHPPEMIPKLIERWQAGAEVVYTVRDDTEGISGFRRWVGRCVYRVISRASGMDLVDQADFRLLDQKAVRAIRGLREQARFVRGLVRWIGFRQASVPYTAEKRFAGASGYSVGQLARMGFAGLLNFSLLPIRTVGYVGVAVFSLGILYLLSYSVLSFFMAVSFSGLAMLAMLAMLLGGLQLIGMAAVGEYVGRIYEESKGRPLYIVRHAQGFEGTEEPEAMEPPRKQHEEVTRFNVMT